MMGRVVVHKSAWIRTAHLVVAISVVFQCLLVAVTGIKQEKDRNLQPSTNRAYGDIPDLWFEDAYKKANYQKLEGDQNNTCGSIIHLDSGAFFQFKIKENRKLCSVIIQAEPGTTLNVQRTELQTRPCSEEHFFYIADDFQKKLVVCGERLPVQISRTKRLLLHFERRAPSDTEFSLTVTALPEDDRTGRSLEGKDRANFHKSYQLYTKYCGYDSPRLSRPETLLTRTEAQRGQFPFLASVFVKRNSTGKRQRCGASILDQRHLLTAANCFWDEDDILEVSASPITAHHEPLRRTFTNHYGVKCVKLFEHRVTKEGWRINDLAIVVLDRDIVFTSYVSSVCLAGPEKFDAFTLAVPGSDYPTVDPVTKAVSSTLPKDVRKMEVANVYVYPNEECERLYHHKLTDKQMCVYDHLNGTCNGQPGSPALAKIEGTYYQVAVSSHGFPCQEGPRNRFGVFTPVAPFLDEIKEKLKSPRRC